MKIVWRTFIGALLVAAVAFGQGADLYIPGGSSSGGAAGAIVSGTTIVTDGVDKSLCFVDGAPINCADGPSFDKATGDLSTPGRIRSGPQAVTCASSGDGSLGAVTVTPTANVVHLTNSDPDGCDVTLGEGSATSGDTATIIVVSNSGGTANIADTAGVSETSGAFNMALYDSITLDYVPSTWVERARSNN